MNVSSEDDRRLLAHLTDLSKRSLEEGAVVCSDFLDERQQGLLSVSARRLVSCMELLGCDENAERRVAVFYPPEAAGYSLEAAWGQLACLHIIPPDRRYWKRELTHRDYLGSLMGLGIKREKTGDIRLDGSGAYVLVKEEVSSYIQEQLTSVGSCIVRVEETDRSRFPKAAAGIVFTVSLPSYRMDAVVSHGFSTGRTQAEKWISQGLVQRNGEPVTAPDKTASIGDRITVRGQGRLVLREEKALSRSGRLLVVMERFGKG